MKEWLTFHKTVRGSSHTKKGLPCQDASYSEDTDEYVLLTVSDGHGDSSCIRSDAGSEIAVKAAGQCLREFAESLLENEELYQLLKLENHQKELVRRLTDSIISSWSDQVIQHFQSHPLETAELEMLGYTEEKVFSREEIEHYYGATLLAAVMTGNLLLMIQQGDGRCVILTDHGAEEPVPWDERCYSNVTTSLSDKDASTRIRYAMIFTDETPVAACFLTSDGVEDSYRDMDGTYRLLKKLTCASVKESQFPQYLEQMVSELSELGSGDDTTVAGSVCLKMAEQLAEQYQKEIIKSETEESLKTDREKLISMERRLAILKKKAEEAGRSIEEIKEEKRHLETQLSILDFKKRSRRLIVDDLNEQQVSELEEAGKSGISRFYFTQFNLLKELHRKYKEAIQSIQNKIDEHDRMLSDPDLEENRVISEYQEYLEKYKEIENRISRTENEIKQSGGN